MNNNKEIEWKYECVMIGEAKAKIHFNYRYITRGKESSDEEHEQWIREK